MYRGGGGLRPPRFRGRGGFRGTRGRGRARGRGYPPGRSPPRRRRSHDSRTHSPNPRAHSPDDKNRDNHYCLFCKMQLTSDSAYQEHKESVVHKQKEILVNKAITDGLHYCYTCEKVFPSKLELDAHCLMARHQPLYRIEGLSEQLTAPESPKSEQQLRRAEDEKDRNKIVTKLNDLREDDDDVTVQNKPNFCKVCDVDCLSESNYKIHVESWRHRAEVDKRKEEQRKFNEEAEKTFQESDQIDQKNVPSIQKDVPSSQKSISSHQARTGYYCQLCKMQMQDKGSYLLHVRGRKHFQQISIIRRPYKCFPCSMNFTVPKEFNHHLESNSHIDIAYDYYTRFGERNRRNDANPNRDQANASRGQAGSSNRERGDRDGRRNEDSNRRVELIASPTDNNDSGDLRDKLQGKTNIVVTKTNDNAPGKKESAYGPKLPSGSSDSGKKQQHILADRRAKELEFEAKFRKLSREYGNDLVALKDKLTREREEDIATYQQFESTYTRLCREEDYVRENIRVLEEKDPRKEEYIRDMIRIQNDMRNVRQELELREMMIIKRESLFRAKFPHDTNNKVVINANEASGKSQQKISEKPPQGKNDQSSADLRVQLERERLVKKLGPELDGLDPSLRDKLMSLIMDNQKTQEDRKNAPAGSKEQSAEKKKQMQLLTEREKQLQQELAALKSNATSQQKKKITRSLVPQYDDVEDEKDSKKRAAHRRSRSGSSDSSASSSSSSSDGDSSKRKDRKRRRRSPSKSYDRGRKKRGRRSLSRDHDRKKKGSSSRRRDDERRKKSDRKKPLKLTIKSKSAPKISKRENPLAIDSEESDIVITNDDNKEPMQQSIEVIGGNTTSPNIYQIPTSSQQQQQQQHQQPQQQQLQVNIPTNIPPQKRETFSLWKNPSAVSASSQPSKDSPKDDVWDIAFSGSSKQEVETEKNDHLTDLFNTNVDSPKALSQEILKILKSVAPNIQNIAQHQQQHEQKQQQNSGQPQEPLQPLRPQNFPSDAVRQFPIPVSESEKLKKFPSYGKLDTFTAKINPESDGKPPETSGGRIRSILKKMKDPVITEAAVPSITTAALSKSGGSGTGRMTIPGLDTPSADDSSKISMTSTTAMTNSSSATDRYVNQQLSDLEALKSSTAIMQTLASIKASYISDVAPGNKSSYPAESDLRFPPNSRYDTYAQVVQTRLRDADPYARAREVYDGRAPVQSDLSRLPPRGYSSAVSQRMTSLDREPLPPLRGRDGLPQDPLIRSYDRDVEEFRRRDQKIVLDDHFRSPAATVRRDPYGRDGWLPEGRGNELSLEPPKRRPGETEKEFYFRFEHYYELKRRIESEPRSLAPPRRLEDDLRRPPTSSRGGDIGGRPPPYGDDRRGDDRYDDRAYRRAPGNFAAQSRLPPQDIDHYSRGRDPRDISAERRYDMPPRRDEEDRRMADGKRSVDGNSRYENYARRVVDNQRMNEMKRLAVDIGKSAPIESQRARVVDDDKSQARPSHTPINRGIAVGLDGKGDRLPHLHEKSPRGGTSGGDGGGAINRRHDESKPPPRGGYDRFNVY